jgi:glycosyltransferase involved in cell wall biosynthesis
MKNKNIIAVPPYYSGTSFEDIVLRLKSAVKNSKTEILFIGAKDPLPNKLSGNFLDDHNYIKGQINLIKTLCQIKNAKNILFLDYFNPGIDILFYNNQQLGNERCKYGALLHGTSFFNDDIYAFSWLKKFELSWAQVYDSIYAPSQHIAKKLPVSISNKVKIFPFGIDGINFVSFQYHIKKYDVIFPHRLNNDKGLTQFIDIVKKMPNVKFFITIPQKEKIIYKNDYYLKLKNFKNVKFIFAESFNEHLNTLSMAKIVLSCAKQENFGYSVIKSVLVGCIPVLPNRLCYPEFINKKFLYNNTGEAVNLMHKYLNDDQKYINRCLTKTRNKVSKFSFSDILSDFFER